jgi:hypothetical protein
MNGTEINDIDADNSIHQSYTVSRPSISVVLGDYCDKLIVRKMQLLIYTLSHLQQPFCTI